MVWAERLVRERGEALGALGDEWEDRESERKRRGRGREEGKRGLGWSQA